MNSMQSGQPIFFFFFFFLPRFCLDSPGLFVKNKESMAAKSLAAEDRICNRFGGNQ